MVSQDDWKDWVSEVEIGSQKRIIANIKKRRDRRVKACLLNRWDDLYFEWMYEWDKRFKDIEMPQWGRKEIGQAKMLIKKIGIVNAVAVVRYVFRNWDVVAKEAKRIGGVPSIQFLLGWFERFYVKAIEEDKKLRQMSEVLDEWRETDRE